MQSQTGGSVEAHSRKRLQRTQAQAHSGEMSRFRKTRRVAGTGIEIGRDEVGNSSGEQFARRSIDVLAQEMRHRGEQAGKSPSRERQRLQAMVVEGFQMIRAFRPEFHGQGRASQALELLGVDPQRETEFPGAFQVDPGRDRIEGSALDENVSGPRQAGFPDRGQHLGAKQLQVILGTLLELEGNQVGAEKGRKDLHAGFPSRGPDGAQGLEFAGEIQTVARLGLAARGSVALHAAEVTRGLAGQLLLGSGPHRPHAGMDAPAASGDLLVAHPGRPPVELLGPLGGEGGMDVSVHEGGSQHPPSAVVFPARPPGGAQGRFRPHGQDLSSPDRDRAILMDG